MDLQAKLALIKEHAGEDCPISIDDLNPTQFEREQHFFKKGYAYALVHLSMALDKEEDQGLEKRLKEYMNFLEE